jgi:hypothetical protein
MYRSLLKSLHTGSNRRMWAGRPPSSGLLCAWGERVSLATSALRRYIAAPCASFVAPLSPNSSVRTMLERGERSPPEKDGDSPPVTLSGEINAATRCVCLSALKPGAY